MTRIFNVGIAQAGNIKPVISLASMSGGGKTFGALSIAYGYLKELHPQLSDQEIFTKIALLDTERCGQASRIYIGQTITDSHSGVSLKIWPYLHVPFPPPYGKDDLKAALDAIKGAGAEVVILDSFTDFWEGEGGILWMQNAIALNAGKQGFNTWTKPKLVHKEIINMINNVDMFGIISVRLKTEWTVDASGVPIKAGLKVIQSGDLEYEFDIAFRIDKETHEFVVEKDRTNMMSGVSTGGMNPELGKHIAHASNLTLEGVTPVLDSVVVEPTPTPVVEPLNITPKVPLNITPKVDVVVEEDPLIGGIVEVSTPVVEVPVEDEVPVQLGVYTTLEQLLMDNATNEGVMQLKEIVFNRLKVENVRDIPQENIEVILKSFQSKI